MIELNTTTEIIGMICKKIETVRIEQELTQKELCSKAGMPYRTYRNLIDNNKGSLINFVSLFHTLGLYSELKTIININKERSIKDLKNETSTRKRVKKV